MSLLRENWRIVLLVALVVLSTVSLFVPVGSGQDGANTTDGGQAGNVNATDVTGGGPTNLKYGLELSGGTRIRAPLVGMTAQGLDVPGNRTQQFELQGRLASELNVSRSEVQINPTTNTVEVFADAEHGNVTRAEFDRALRNAGFESPNIRSGVTAGTRERVVAVLNNKISAGGLQGGSASVVTTPAGRHFILVEVPGATREEVLDLIGTPGRVEVVAHFPVQRNGTRVYRNVTLFSQDGIASMSQAQEGRQGQTFVRVTLEKPTAKNFSHAMREFGFTSEGAETCRWQTNPDNAGWCLFTVLDGEIVYAAGMDSSLATTIESKDFVKSPTFRMIATNMSEARELQLNLEAGALPTNLAIETGGSTYYLEPSLASRFKFLSLVTGFVAVLAVTVVIFLRYGSPGVSIPMLLTAGAEVYLLLGFAAAVGLALDLSHIAGFIAVIGTGVDDLVIIADEILQRGEIRTDRVFKSRFKKAFWVIGAAAATTIIAMSPLAVLSLGDLKGFAIVTIVGVLIGVLVTRPVYGDILRNLIVD